jgi:ubiquinone/menaquinone biosynthesis C-methylase UbiE
MDSRKKLEKELHNRIRDKSGETNNQHLISNKKFYSITRTSEAYYKKWLEERCENKRVLDYCCGNGEHSFFIAGRCRELVGIDISDVSVENCKRNALNKGVNSNTFYFTMDAENLQYEDDYFDIIICRGVLHHLDMQKAFPELARVLNPEGEIICIEPLVYNPIIHLYRMVTPHLRTKWEAKHILKKRDLDTARDSFNEVEVKYYHLATLLAIPFRNLKVFRSLLGLLEKIDSVILSLPLVKWLAWQVLFVLAKPKKNSISES